jgi:hypothetical protein
MFFHLARSNGASSPDGYKAPGGEGDAGERFEGAGLLLGPDYPVGRCEHCPYSANGHKHAVAESDAGQGITLGQGMPPSPFVQRASEEGRGREQQKPKSASLRKRH